MSSTRVFYFPLQTPIFSDRVKLVPFDTVPPLSVKHGLTQSSSPICLVNNFESIDVFKALITQPGTIFSNANPESCLFAIIDITRERSPEDEEGELAGIIAYLNASETNLSAEIGAIVVLPKFQQTHVTSHAVGLLMHTAYASPEEGGLGLARTEWKCNSTNIASMKVAERMGYQKVGVIPYHMKFPLGKRTGKIGNGKVLPPGSDPDDLWRDTILYSLSWDVWESEARGKVERAMNR